MNWFWNTLIVLCCMWNFCVFLAFAIMWWEQRKTKFVILEILKMGPVWPTAVAPVFENVFQRMAKKIRGVK